MWQQTATVVPLIALPVMAGYGFYRTRKHLYIIYNEEKKLSYSDEKIPFDKSTQNVIDELTKYITLRWKVHHVAGIRWFWSNTQDPVTRGSTATKPGTLLGIPYRFSYQTVEDIDTSKIPLVGDQTIDKKSPDGGKLLNSLILSDDAKRFALARELHFINTNYVHVDSLSRLLIGSVGLFVAIQVHHRSLFNFSRTKHLFRMLTYATITLLTIYCHEKVSKTYFHNLHIWADAQAAGMGKEYAMGGIDYFTQILERNQSLRSLSGKSGEQIYLPWGDEISAYSPNSCELPISVRLKYLVNRSREIYSEDEAVMEKTKNFALLQNQPSTG